MPFFGNAFFRMTGFLSSKHVGKTAFSFCMILVVYLGHGIFHPEAVLVFLRQNQFFG